MKQMRFNVPEGSSKESHNTLYIVRGKGGGKPCWHIVLVDPEKEDEFLKQASFGFMDVAEYGRILSSGLGENPDF